MPCHYYQRDRYQLPRLDVAALLHEGAEREPETVEDGEVVGDRRSVGVVLDVPLEGTEPTDEEQHDADAEFKVEVEVTRSRGGDDADADVGEDDAHPDLVGERLHERHDARRVLLLLLEHDADAEAHERLAEVDDALACRRDRQRRQSQVGLLRAPPPRFICFIHIRLRRNR